MARSPLTLAAAVTSALPRAGVVGAGPLTSGGAGRCDSAVVSLDDGRTLVVRAPSDASAARELAAEALALRALTPGVRSLLGVRAPELYGEVGLGDARALVCDLLPGYQVDAAHLPAGPGAAPSVGRAIAAVHGLPASVVRGEGLPARSPEEVREETLALLGRAEATRRVPKALLERWRAALASDALWRFESTVTLGGAAATSFLFEDTDAGPAVTGLLDWHGLSVGDPAVDFRWLSSAPSAADDVYDGYQAAVHRAPDAQLQRRARLYAELEFAKWLVHGNDAHRSDIVDDAVALLDALAGGVQDDDLLNTEGTGPLDLDEAIALLDRVPEPAAAVDTSMQTDAYDPDQLSLFIAAERDGSAPVESNAPERSSVASTGDDTSTAPIEIPVPVDAGDDNGLVDMSAWIDAKMAAQPTSGSSPASAESSDVDPLDEEVEAERASRAAFQRWASSSSE